MKDRRLDGQRKVSTASMLQPRQQVPETRPARTGGGRSGMHQPANGPPSLRPPPPMQTSTRRKREPAAAWHQHKGRQLVSLGARGVPREGRRHQHTSKQASKHPPPRPPPPCQGSRMRHRAQEPPLT